MATPTTLPNSWSSGDVLTATAINDLRGAFRILQVVEGSDSTLSTSTSTTYADTGVTATITPYATSSKILVIVNQSIYTTTGGTDTGIRLIRGSTTVATYLGFGYGTASGNFCPASFQYLDSPATTSATTYKTQLSRVSGTGTVYTEANGNRGSILLLEVSA